MFAFEYFYPKAGFITALYIVLVPVFGRIIFGNKTSPNIWLGVVVAAGGLYFLCVNESFSVAAADLWEIACAFIFTIQILLIDRYAEGTDSALVSQIQFLVSAVLALPFVLIMEKDTSVEHISGAWLCIAYTGIFSSAVGYTLQVVGQKNSKNPTVASLLMSLESLFAAFFGWLILKQRLSGHELIGIVLMMFAIVISQFSFGKKENYG